MTSLARFAAGLALLGALAVRPRTAAAQVNVERLRGQLGESPATATLDGNFTALAGNVRGVTLGAAGRSAARVGRHRFFGSTSADYASFRSVTSVSKSFVHLRYNYELLYWLRAEAFVQGQQDRFQRLLRRSLAGLGPRFVLWDEPDLIFAVGSAYMLETESIRVAEGATDAPTTTAHRWSNYASTTWKVDERVDFVATIYLQPRFDAFDDVRSLFEASALSKISGRLGLKVLATVRYDSAPPTTVRTLDVEVKNSLTWTF